MNKKIYLIYLSTISLGWIFFHTKLRALFTQGYPHLCDIGFLFTLSHLLLHDNATEVMSVNFFYFLLSYTLAIPFRVFYSFKKYSFTCTFFKFQFRFTLFHIVVIIYIIVLIFLFIYFKKYINKNFSERNYPYNFYVWYDYLFYSLIEKFTNWKLIILLFFLISQPILFISFVVRLKILKTKPYFVIIIQHFFLYIHFYIYIPFLLKFLTRGCHAGLIF